ncbi:MAG TPA: cysteine desulfurase [Planctomycetaceae bacterium]
MTCSHLPARSGIDLSPLDVTAVRDDFPILRRPVGGRPVAYLDSAATSLKPQPVIDAVVGFYERYTANVHRGAHRFGREASERFDAARETIASFINAETREVVFVRNATEAINLVARSLPADAAVLTTLAEHHSNALPWRCRGPCHNVRIDPDGRIDTAHLGELLARFRPRLVAVSYVTNAFGVVNPVDDVVREAHAAGALVLVDGSQAVPHRPVDVKSLGCDFLCFSGHKMCGPSGIGVLYGKRERLEELSFFHYGGDMVAEVHESEFVARGVPWRLEAGTPFIEGAIGLAAACEYLDALGLDRIERHERELVRYALHRLADVPGVTVHGPTSCRDRAGSVSFTVRGLEAHAVARILSDRDDIFVRSGYHCAQPLHEAFGLPPTVRASFYLYNDAEEIDRLAAALGRLRTHLSP